MKLFIDLTGKTFGKLTVQGVGPRKKTGNRTRMTWICQCSCGNTAIIIGDGLKHRGVRSCGCLKKDNLLQGRTIHGAANRGLCTPEYRSWNHMKQRCQNRNAGGWHHYGGRGIAVCERWKYSFANFLEDMGPRPPGTSLDRIDNNGGYSKANCRWATIKTQLRNTRKNKIITTSAGSYCVAEWAERTGIPVKTLMERVNAKWSPEDCLYPKSKSKKSKNGNLQN